MNNPPSEPQSDPVMGELTVQRGNSGSSIYSPYETNGSPWYFVGKEEAGTPEELRAAEFVPGVLINIPQKFYKAGMDVLHWHKTTEIYLGTAIYPAEMPRKIVCPCGKDLSEIVLGYWLAKY